MDLDQEELATHTEAGASMPIAESNDLDTTGLDVLIESGNEAMELKQKTYLQLEVMKKLGFFPTDFDAENLSAEVNKDNDNALALWAMDMPGVKDTSYAAFFDDEWQRVIRDPQKRNMLKSNRDTIIEEIADNLLQRRIRLN